MIVVIKFSNKLRLLSSRVHWFLWLQIPTILNLIDFIFVLIFILLIFVLFVVISGLKKVSPCDILFLLLSLWLSLILHRMGTCLRSGSNLRLHFFLLCFSRVRLVHDVISKEIEGLVALFGIETLRFFLCPKLFLLILGSCSSSSWRFYRRFGLYFLRLLLLVWFFSGGCFG